MICTKVYSYNTSSFLIVEDSIVQVDGAVCDLKVNRTILERLKINWDSTIYEYIENWCHVEAEWNQMVEWWFCNILLDILNYVVSSSTLTISDSIKYYKTITQPSDSTQLQCDINSLSRWSTVWNHKSRLTTLQILPLMYILERMIFFICNLK